MEVSNLFVCLMGMGVTFIGLICLILLITLMGKIVGGGTAAKTAEPSPSAAPAAPAAPASVSPAVRAIPNRGELVAAAAVEGAQAAVELCVSIAGMLCLWTGVMEIMRRSGLAEGLSRLLRPVLSLLFPQVSGDRGVMDSISANVSANLLGLGNAATPLGIEAVRRMERKTPGTASDAMCMLVVCNTASIQLIPTTVASVRAAAGCSAPVDKLPAVWLATALSVGGGISACKLIAPIWRD